MSSAPTNNTSQIVLRSPRALQLAAERSIARLESHELRVNLVKLRLELLYIRYGAFMVKTCQTIGIEMDITSLQPSITPPDLAYWQEYNITLRLGDMLAFNRACDGIGLHALNMRQIVFHIGATQQLPRPSALQLIKEGRYMALAVDLCEDDRAIYPVMAKLPHEKVRLEMIKKIINAIIGGVFRLPRLYQGIDTRTWTTLDAVSVIVEDYAREWEEDEERAEEGLKEDFFRLLLKTLLIDYKEDTRDEAGCFLREEW